MTTPEKVRKYQATIIPKTCIECGRVFEQRRSLSGICSDECKAARRARFRPKTAKTCAHCGDSFAVDRLERTYCSYACKVAAQTGKASAKRGRRYEHLDRARIGHCLVCGVEYKATGDHATREQRYCSHTCYMKSREETTIEAAVREALTAIGVSFKAQHRIGSFYVDFLLPNNIVIEADGDYWHSRPEVAEKDRRKDAYLTSEGYRVLHLTESEIRQGQDVIVRRWENFTGQTATLADETPMVKQ